MRIRTSWKRCPSVRKKGRNGASPAMKSPTPASPARWKRTNGVPFSTSGTRVTGRSSTAEPDVANTRLMARPRTRMMARIATNTATSAFAPLLVTAETVWLSTPSTSPPISAPGSDTNAPNAAAPNVSIKRYGPSVAALKLAWFGACRIADTAAKAPARPHVTALTRPTDTPHRRAASGLLAAARICLPIDENRRNAASAATRIGTSTIVSTDIPVSTTCPMRQEEWNGCG